MMTNGFVWKLYGVVIIVLLIGGIVISNSDKVSAACQGYDRANSDGFSKKRMNDQYLRKSDYYELKLKERRERRARPASLRNDIQLKEISVEERLIPRKSVSDQLKSDN